jgi:glutathione S-transferase
VILALGGRPGDAREAAEEASELAESLHYPVGNAAAFEARGMAEEDPEEGAALLAEAARAWQLLDRPLEAARSRLLAGRVLLSADPERARELLDAAAVEIERLGVPHLAQRARALAAG